MLEFTKETSLSATGIKAIKRECLARLVLAEEDDDKEEEKTRKPSFCRSNRHQQTERLA